MSVAARALRVVAGLALAAGLALGAAACTSKDATYCDEQAPCPNAGDFCDLETKTCEPKRDASVAQKDAQTDAPTASDAGCEAPKHQCGNSCYDLTDPAHCGESCQECTVPTNGAATCTDGTTCGFTCNDTYYVEGEACLACDVALHCGATCATCTGTTPDCSGHTGKCVCNSSSCGTGTTPICDTGTGACRACQEHSECASGACDRFTGGCVAVSDIIYVDSNDADCDDAGTGTATVPFCAFTPAFQTWSTTSRYCIKVAAGDYAFMGARVVQDKKLIVVGVDSTSTQLVQSQTGAMVFLLFQVTGTAELALYGVTVRRGDGAYGHGIGCTGSSVPAVLLVESSVIRNNGGNGIYATQCAVTVSQSTLRDNTGRGVRAADRCTVTLKQSILSGNVGGGAYVADSGYTIENCLIADNGRSGAGGSALGGVDLSSPGDPAIFINNTVADNRVKDSALAGGVLCSGGATVVNSILSNNEHGEQNGCTFEYSDIWNWTGGGPGNIGDAPLFVDATNGNYRLKTSPVSPAIDKGTTTGAPLVDLEGNARSNTPDMGCYEAQ